MPIYIPENDITLDAERDEQTIDVTVEESETEIILEFDDDGQIFVNEAKAYRDQAKEYSEYAMSYRDESYTYSESASSSASSATASAESASDNATLSRSWAVGDTETREGEETDNSKYYALLSGANADTSQRYAEEAEDTIDTIRELTIGINFTVNFTTGELEYVSPDITFLVNTTTGNLDWEVA